jgi:hypothetical protein
LAVDGTVEGQRIRLDSAGQPAEVLLLAAAQDTTGSSMPATMNGETGQDIVYYAPTRGLLQTVTIFLVGNWVGAEAELDREGQVLRLAQGDAVITLPLPSGE